ncbi:hypothetical protein HU147_10485 [Planomicrobium chinense]|uniref:hypothetical protein n=1 Tax=Planococcus chinensis TaxID=272917 RepID=UPI001CC733BD|nr:hypothetical protein [Planococcus chinensis]MBZ5201644.1 hypothetical protein [Planococcus chinensis]
MARKGTAGRMPEKQLGATESGIDKMVNKTKQAFDKDNDATDYEEVKGEDEMEAAKEYSKKAADNPPERETDGNV